MTINHIANSNKNNFFKKNAFSYFSVDIENLQRVKIIKDIVSKYVKANSKRNLKILDLGSGNGEITKIFLELGFDEIYAVDICKTKFFEKKIKIIKANIEEDLPFKNNFFDYVFMGEIIEHIFDTKKLLTEVNRILKINGKLLITTPNLVHLPERLRVLFGLSPNCIAAIHKFLYLHIRYFTKNTLAYALEVTGFMVEKIKSTMVVFKWNGDKVVCYSRLLSKLIPGFGNTLIIESIKKS